MKAATQAEKAEYIALQLAKERLSLEKSLKGFVRESWKILEPETEFLDNWHIDAMCEYLDAVRLGQILRLIINVPPRYAKSNIVTINFPVQWWTTEPAERFVFTSYSDSLAKEHSLKRRDIIESQWYQERWGDKVELSDDQNEKREFKNTHAGVMVALPIGGSVTGKGGNCIIIDDPVDPESAESTAERVAACRFIERTLSTRLNNKKTGRMVMVMQRLHEKDPTGHELAKGGWELLKLPAIAEKKTIIVLPITGRRIVREQGDILHPEREGAKELAIQKTAMTDPDFAGQYQQEPSPTEGALIKRSWWKRYLLIELPTEFDFVIDSWDCSFKDTQKADYVVGTKWGIKGGRIYLLHVTRDRMGLPDTCIALKHLAAQEPRPNVVLVEDKANGTAVVEVMQKILPNVIAVEPQGGKVARVNAVSPCVKAGNVYVPADGEVEWGKNASPSEFIEECARFTGKDGETDDQVDSMSQAIIRFVLNAGGMLEWMRKQYEAQHGAQAEEEARDTERRQVASGTLSKTMQVVKNGGHVECSKDAYKEGIRGELVRCIQQATKDEDLAAVEVFMTERRRLDSMFGIDGGK